MPAEEGFSVTLPCLSTNEKDEYDERSWYNGRFNRKNSPKENDTLFRQDEHGDIIISNGTLGMLIHKDNFSMSIDPAKLEDNGNYTCCVYTEGFWGDRKTWDQIELQIYSEYGGLSFE